MEAALNLCRECRRLGIRLIIVDGSPEAVKESLANIGRDHQEIIEECEHPRGVFGPARRQGFNRIKDLFDREMIDAGGWIEPEKSDLLRFVSDLVQPIAEGEVNGTIPGRTEASIRTLPPFQEQCERTGNLAFEMMTRHKLDVWSGPRFFDKKFLHHFLEYKGTYGDKWDCIFIPVIRALSAGYSLKSIPVLLQYPASMVAEEEENQELRFDKRITQLQNLVSAMRQECESNGMIPTGSTVTV